MLKEDEIKFVKKSVGNQMRDWVKLNPKEANKVFDRWAKSSNTNTLWIVKQARR